MTCYSYMVGLIMGNVELDEVLTDMYEQPWYPAMAERIRKVAETHDLYPDPFIHEGE